MRYRCALDLRKRFGTLLAQIRETITTTDLDHRMKYFDLKTYERFFVLENVSLGKKKMDIVFNVVRRKFIFHMKTRKFKISSFVVKGL